MSKLNGRRRKSSETVLSTATERGDNGSSGDFDTSTREALMIGHRALVRMRVAILRSIKALVRNRVPARDRKIMETRYASTLRRVKLLLAMVAEAGLDSTTTTPSLAAATLLGHVYRLEREMLDADEECYRLSTGGGYAKGCETTPARSCDQKGWFSRWFN